MFYRTVEIDGQKVKVVCFPIDSYEKVLKMAHKKLYGNWFFRLIKKVN